MTTKILENIIKVLKDEGGILLDEYGTVFNLITISTTGTFDLYSNEWDACIQSIDISNIDRIEVDDNEFILFFKDPFTLKGHNPLNVVYDTWRFTVYVTAKNLIDKLII